MGSLIKINIAERVTSYLFSMHCMCTKAKVTVSTVEVELGCVRYEIHVSLRYYRCGRRIRIAKRKGNKTN
jgi:hypothetical protein